MTLYRLALSGLILVLLLAACTPSSSVKVSGEYTLQAITAEGK